MRKFFINKKAVTKIASNFKKYEMFIHFLTEKKIPFEPYYRIKKNTLKEFCIDGKYLMEPKLFDEMKLAAFLCSVVLEPCEKGLLIRRK